MALSHGVVGMSAVCDCGISRSYSFTFLFYSIVAFQCKILCYKIVSVHVFKINAVANSITSLYFLYNKGPVKDNDFKWTNNVPNPSIKLMNYLN